MEPSKPKEINGLLMQIILWKWFDNDYKVHCKSRATYEKIVRWKYCKPGGVYYIPNQPNEYDVIIPEKYVERVIKMLNLKKVYKSEYTEDFKSETIKLGTKPALNDNELRDVKSPPAALNQPGSMGG